jgi:hypothetical protein
MFEYEQDIVECLLNEDDDFKRLYEKHSELKQKVKEANLGTRPMDDFSLEDLKKQKLSLKDQMAAKIATYRSDHA